MSILQLYNKILSDIKESKIDFTLCCNINIDDGELTYKEYETKILSKFNVRTNKLGLNILEYLYDIKEIYNDDWYEDNNNNKIYFSYIKYELEKNTNKLRELCDNNMNYIVNLFNKFTNIDKILVNLPYNLISNIKDYMIDYNLYNFDILVVCQYIEEFNNNLVKILVKNHNKFDCKIEVLDLYYTYIKMHNNNLKNSFNIITEAKYYYIKQAILSTDNNTKDKYFILAYNEIIKEKYNLLYEFAKLHNNIEIIEYLSNTYKEYIDE